MESQSALGQLVFLPGYFYLQNQDLSGLTPSQLLDKYDDVYDEINNHYKEKRQQKKTSNF